MGMMDIEVQEKVRERKPGMAPLDGPRTQTDPCGPTASEKPHWARQQDSQLSTCLVPGLPITLAHQMLLQQPPPLVTLPLARSSNSGFSHLTLSLGQKVSPTYLQAPQYPAQGLFYSQRKCLYWFSMLCNITFIAA